LIAKQLSQKCRKNFCSEETCRRLQQRGTPLFSLNSALAKQQRGIHAPLTNFLSENSLIHQNAQAQHPRIFHEGTATFQASNKRGCPFVTDLQCLVAFKILSQMSKDFLDPNVHWNEGNLPTIGVILLPFIGKIPRNYHTCVWCLIPPKIGVMTHDPWTISKDLCFDSDNKFAGLQISASMAQVWSFLGRIPFDRRSLQ